MRRALAITLAVGFAACGDTQSCGGDPDYVYPRDDIAAATPTRRAVRARLTESGLAAIADGVPAIIAAGCAGNPPDGSASCAMDPDPVHPDRVRLYMATANTSATSYLALDLATMEGNVHVTLMQESDGPGAVEVTLGCNAASVAACDDLDANGDYVWADQFIQGSLDMVVYPDAYAACFVNETAAPGFVIRSLRFVMRPHIELGLDLKPYLVLDRADIGVTDLDTEMNIVVGPELSDPGCVTDVPLLGDVCSFQCTLINGAEAFAEWLFETDLVDELLAKTIADLVLKQFAAQALEGEGSVDLGALLPGGNRRATTTGFLFSAAVSEPDAVPPVWAPSVTGSTDNLGWNFDLDAGFVAEHGPCVPVVTPGSFALPAPPDVGSQVQALDPETGEPVMEQFDFALILGDVVLQRAAFELFDSGALCLGLDAETVATGGIVPNVAMVSLLAPGIEQLAPLTAPVDFVLSPRYPPVIAFGTGQQVGDVVDSHVKIVWPELWIDIYPWVDDAPIRALTFTVDLLAGASFQGTPTGDLALMVDDVALVNVAQIYNEMIGPFDAEGLETIMGLLLPMVLTGQATELALDTAALGLPFAPKIRAVDRAGTTDDFLAAFMRFCDADAIADPTNALCYDPYAGLGNGAGRGALAVQWLAGPGGDLGVSTAQVGARSDLGAAADLELAYRVDGGPWFNFRGPDADGLFALRHPRLAVPGVHEMQVVARHRWRPTVWSDPFTLAIESPDRPIPVVSLAAVPVSAPAVAGADRAATAETPAQGCNAAGGAMGWAAVLAFAIARRSVKRRR